MDHVIEYEEYDEAKYIGKLIEELTFKTDRSDLLLIKIFDNKTYCIDFYVRDHREYKHANMVSLDASVDDFNRIDPEFRGWLSDNLKKHFEL